MTVSLSRRPQTSLEYPPIGNYEILAKLATGGMGEVYLAKQRGPVAFSRNVVLKKLHPDHTREPQFVAMFLNEAQISANLVHSNIVHVYELFEEGSGYVLAMEYVRGGTVLRLLRAASKAGRALPLGPALRIAIAVAEALHYAYTTPDEHGMPRHVIHRDVSPSNVLIGYDGRVKLADFGVAKALDSEMTQGTSIKGKYGYLSPEQVRCKPLDNRSDIFSLGILLWEMTTGQALFRRENDVAMMYAVVEEPIQRPSEVVPDYAPEVEAVVMKALERDREARYSTALELADELRRIAHERGLDIEAGALAELVSATIPDDQVAFGRIGTEEETPRPSRPRARTLLTGDWSDWSEAGSYASVEISPTRQPAPKASRGPVVVTTLLMIALTIAFWAWVVPAVT